MTLMYDTEHRTLAVLGKLGQCAIGFKALSRMKANA